jgi:hypothetical protein
MVRMALSYDGKCGGFFPGLSGRRQCSWSEYLFGEVVAIGLVLALSYWPVILTLMIVPPFIGHLLDRKR